MRCPVCNKSLNFNECFNNAFTCTDCSSIIVIRKVTWDNGKKFKTFEYPELDGEPKILKNSGVKS